jgi:hypothetical protein
MKTGFKILFVLAVLMVSAGVAVHQFTQQQRWRQEVHRVRAASASAIEETTRLRNELARLRVDAGAVADRDRLVGENASLRGQVEDLTTRLNEAQASLAQTGRRRPGQWSSTIEAGALILPDSALAARAKGPSWGHSQATGAPDTHEAGDIQTAWASREPDGGVEWLQLKYDKPVEVSAVNIHETYNPGAVSKITALMPNGSEQTLWEGTAPREEAPIEMSFPIPPGVRSDQIKVYVDTDRVPGWNEIDAVELVGADGSRQWASSSSASSYYGDQRGSEAVVEFLNESVLTRDE